MAIEAVYPYIAVAYGTFGIVFGVMLWWKTQRRIDRTKSAIEIQVANAVKDITAKVDEKLEFDIPEYDLAPIMAKLDALESGIPDMVGTHISMAIKGVKAEEGKAVASYVESLGIEGLTEEAKEAAIERLSLKQRAAYELLTMKVPSKTRKSHPMSATVFERSRGLVAQAIMEADERETGGVTIEGRARGSFGVR
jgi:hypothetical protein